jgi:hypothetical protein
VNRCWQCHSSPVTIKGSNMISHWNPAPVDVGLNVWYRLSAADILSDGVVWLQFIRKKQSGTGNMRPAKRKKRAFIPYGPHCLYSVLSIIWMRFADYPLSGCGFRIIRAWFFFKLPSIWFIELRTKNIYTKYLVHKSGYVPVWLIFRCASALGVGSV